MTFSNKPSTSYQKGLWAERIAVLWLLLKGYRILFRRLKTYKGEIDIVAQRGNMICVIEVKRRQTPSMALYSVTPRQQKRLQNAARFLPLAQGLTLRFDVIIITPYRLPYHLKNAF